MATNRVFFTQEALEIWMAEGRADMDGDTVTLDSMVFEVATGVHFVSEVTGEPDTAGLIGVCKTQDQLAELGAEHVSDSVILEDNAYEVVEGFLACPPAQPPEGGSAAIVAAFTRE